MKTKRIYNLLSNLYSEHCPSNLAAYEIRLQLGEEPGAIALSWSNYEEGLTQTEVLFSASVLPNWAIRMLHKYPFLWASEADDSGFCYEAGVFVDTPDEWGHKVLEW